MTEVNNRTILILHGEIKPNSKMGLCAYDYLSSSQMDALSRYEHWQLKKYFDIYFFNEHLGLIKFDEKIVKGGPITNRNSTNDEIKFVVKRLQCKLKRLNPLSKLVVMLNGPLRLYFLFNLHIKKDIRNRVWIGSESIGIQRRELRLLASETIY